MINTNFLSKEWLAKMVRIWHEKTNQSGYREAI
jgi:hypothetical protein